MKQKQLFWKTATGLVATAAVVTSGTNLLPALAQSPPTNKTRQNTGPIYSLRGHIWEIASLDFSPDGQTLISGSFDQTIKVWNLKTGKMLRTLDGHKDGVNSVIISSDGQIFATAGGAAQANTDKTIKIWNFKTGKLLRTLKGHSQGITSLAITPDGQTLVSASYDKTIKLWNLKTGQLLHTLTGHSSWVRAVTISPDGQTLASGGGSLDRNTDTSTKLWNLKTGQLLRTFSGNSSPITFLAFSPNGQNLITGADPSINVWNLQTGKLLRSLNIASLDGVTSMNISPNGQTIVTTALDGSVKLWSLSNGKLLKTLIQPINNPQNYDRLYPSSTAFSPDSKTLAIGHGGGAALSSFPIDIQPISF